MAASTAKNFCEVGECVVWSEFGGKCFLKCIWVSDSEIILRNKICSKTFEIGNFVHFEQPF